MFTTKVPRSIQTEVFNLKFKCMSSEVRLEDTCHVSSLYSYIFYFSGKQLFQILFALPVLMI